MPANPPGPTPLDGVSMPTWIMRYDKNGACESPKTRAALLDHLRASDYTDLIGFSHGWNNDFDDATALYAEFLRRFEAAVAAHKPARTFKPLFFGIIWPSTWLVFDKGPKIAAVPGQAIDSPSTRDVRDEMSSKIEAAGGAEARKRLDEYLKMDTLSPGQANDFAALVAPAFALNDDENRDGAWSARPADVLSMLRELERAEQADGGAAPNIDDWGTGPGTQTGPQAAGILDKLDPRSAIRLFSVYQMKDRAGTVGYNGMSALLRDVLDATAAAKPRLHAVGHSYGCKVMLSAICHPTPLARPIDSLLLMEPAISYLCFAARVPGNAKPGGYREALDDDRVRKPILSTYSKKDFPLHDTFHLALRRAADVGELQIAADRGTTAGDPPNRFAALGGYGPRGAGQRLVDPMPKAGAAYPSLADDPIIGLDGSAGIIGGHGDVKSDATAWALYQLAFRSQSS